MSSVQSAKDTRASSRLLETLGGDLALREAPRGGASWGKAVEIPVDLIDFADYNPNEQDPETFQKEINSIKRFGFVSPVIVRKIGDRYRMVDGEHRIKAAMELGMTIVPAFDIGPISDHEAMQLTVILNELRGKPEERKLGEVLKRLLASDTLDRLTEVLPYSKEEYGKIAKLPEFDWDAMRQRNEERSEKRWVERIFRMSAEAAKVLDEALKLAKNEDDMSDAQALEAIASDFVGR